MGQMIDTDTFSKRLQKLYKGWEDERWKSVGSFVITNGNAVEDGYRYLKSRSLQLWLFGYELPGTIIAFRKDGLHFITSKKKAEVLQSVKDAGQKIGKKIEFHVKEKNDDGSKQVAELISYIKQAGPGSVGHLPKEQHEGSIIQLWKSEFDRSFSNLVDVSQPLAHLMAIKDDGEIKKIKSSGLLAAKVLQDYTVKQIEQSLENEKGVRHTLLSEMTEKIVQDPRQLKLGLNADNVDVAYPPLIQSGGKFDLRIGAAPNEESLYIESGVIYCAVGSKFKEYCANLARTYLVEGTKQQEAEYNVLKNAQQAAIDTLKPGVQLRNVYKAVVDHFKENNMEHLASHLSKYVGFGIGLELKDTVFSIGPNSNETMQPGMVFNIAVGVENLQNPDAKSSKVRAYSMGLSDTVVVQANGCEVLTSYAPKEDTFYSLNDNEESEDDVKEEDDDVEIVQNGNNENGNGYKGYAMRQRDMRNNADFANTEYQRQENQKRLAELKTRQTAERLQRSKGNEDDDQQQKVGKSIVEINAYKSFNQVPFSKDLIVQIDREKECIFVPIYGVMVPFHIVTIKNITSNQDGSQAYVRINFNFTGNYEPAMKFPNMILLKELSFRASDSKRAQRLVTETKVLRQQVLQRDREAADRATLVKQEKLIRGKKAFRLPDVWIRPNFGIKGRKIPGMLESHQNGFRYSTLKAGEEIEVMYRNIKHAFFQPAENDQITLLHFYLINPIMLGKNKTQHIQFYAEVMEVVQTLEGRKQYGYDPDEIEEEQRERARRMQINENFQQFVNRIQDLWDKEFGDLNLEFDIPFRDLGFDGVPAKSTVFLIPTSKCLVQLIEMPFYIVTLSEVEIVALERASLNLKNFDMALVFKDFSKEVSKIDAIPSKSCDHIKAWLNDSNIKYYEIRANLVWKEVLKSIQSDPEGFVENGGWDFLDIDKSDSEANSEDELEGDEEFNPVGDDSEVGEEEDDEESSDYDDSEDFEDEDEEDEEEEEDEEYSDEEDRGMSWDELEAKAAKEDKEKDYSDEEEDNPRKRKKPMVAVPNKKFRR